MSSRHCEQISPCHCEQSEAISLFLIILFKICLLCILSLFIIFLFSQISLAAQTERIAGSDRYETAAAISQKGWPNGANAVIIASGENFPDALVAAPLAGKYNAPILLTYRDVLTGVTRDEIKRLFGSQPEEKEIFIIGTDDVISFQAVSEIEEKLNIHNKNIHRLGGKDRYETALLVAEWLSLPQNNTAVLTTGEDFPDALSIAPLSSLQGMPIILVSLQTTGNTLAKIENTLYGLHIEKLIITGGKDVVSSEIEEWFKNRGFTILTRLWGDDRYGTSKIVADYSMTINNGLNPAKVFITTGENFPDALVATALAGSSNYRCPILLTRTSLNPTPIKCWLGTNVGNINDIYFIGDENVVPNIQIAIFTKDLIVNKNETPSFSNGVYKFKDSRLIVEGNLNLINSDLEIDSSHLVVKENIFAKNSRISYINLEGESHAELENCSVISVKANGNSQLKIEGGSFFRIVSTNPIQNNGAKIYWYNNHDEFFENIINNVTRNARNDSEKMISLLNYVHETITDGSPLYKPTPVTIKDFFIEKQGSCDQQSNALCELAKYADFPGGLVGLGKTNYRDFHTVAEIYVNGRWGVFDPMYGMAYQKEDGSFISAEEIHYNPILGSEKYKVGSGIYYDLSAYYSIIAPFGTHTWSEINQNYTIYW